VLDDGSRADVEMQVRNVPALASRLAYYTTRDYSTQLRQGGGYDLLTPTTTIAWLAEPLLPELERLHSIFSLREHHTHAPFGDRDPLTIHLLQLPYLSPTPPKGYAARVHRWARFLTAQNDGELDQLASEDPMMFLARRTLDHLSQDPEAQRRADERADAIKLHRIDLLSVRLEAEARGEAKGRVELLLKLLGLRFGRLSESTCSRIAAASIEQIDRWAERVLTAPSLDALLEP
jgi:predicted transposase/invertase (TIGR01784 family)